MAGGGDALALHDRTGVWWDLNSCPVPAGVEPGRVRACIESALEKEMGRRSQVFIYAIGNLEYISSDLLEKISSSGIVLVYAPCGGNSLRRLLPEWSEHSPPPATVMLISNDYSMVNPSIFRGSGFTVFCAYPNLHRPRRLDVLIEQKIFLKEFVWETLLNDYMMTTTMMINEDDDEPLCICDICGDDYFETCGEFISHFKSDEHRKMLFDIAPKDPDSLGPRHLCKVCNYPGYDEDNMLLHKQSEEHMLKRKSLADKNRAQVWWDLNSCPVPAGVEPGRVRACIESALEKEMGRRSQVIIYAFGNLDYISSDLLEEISSSGIVLVYDPCGGSSLESLLCMLPVPATVMQISCDYSMANNPLLLRPDGFTVFCAYPKDYRPALHNYNVFAKEFVWETLLNDNMTTCGGEMMMMIVNQPPLCICDVCHDTFEICPQFIAHLKSKEHLEELFEAVPRDTVPPHEPKHLCQVCNYPGYDEYNMLLHNQSEEHIRKKNLAEKKG